MKKDTTETTSMQEDTMRQTNENITLKIKNK